MTYDTQIQMQIATHPIEKYFQFIMQIISFNQNVTIQITLGILYWRTFLLLLLLYSFRYAVEL